MAEALVLVLVWSTVASAVLGLAMLVFFVAFGVSAIIAGFQAMVNARPCIGLANQLLKITVGLSIAFTIACLPIIAVL